MDDVRDPVLVDRASESRPVRHVALDDGDQPALFLVEDDSEP